MEIVDKKNRCIIRGREKSFAPNSISLFCDFQLLSPRTPANIIVDIYLIFITQALKRAKTKCDILSIKVLRLI